MALLSYSRAIADAAERDPDHVAVTCAGESITRAELESRTNRLARAYAELGVSSGSFVTVGLPNSVAFLEACFAAWKLGATPQPISYRLPDRERTAIVDLADSALIVGADPAAHPGRTVIPVGWQPDPSIDDSQLPDAVAEHLKAPTSGGSTGRPKLIVATMPSLRPETPSLGQRYDGVALVPGPLYHNAPFSFATGALTYGNHLVILPKFDAEATLAAIDAHRPDWLLLVPTMMQRITRLPDEVRSRYDVSSLQTVWHMASPCPPWLKEAWIDWLGGEKIFELYAGTEAQSVTVVRGDDWLAHRGTVGRPVSGEMRIQDPDTFEVLPPGEIGEVFMRTGGDLRTYEYIGAEARVSPDGWESLGDMGSMDADGYLYLADRRSDMILSGGANIYPAEIEAAIDEHPSVVSCAAIGLPDDDLGSTVHAVVQISEPIDVDELRTFLAERLVRYKIPRTFEFVTDVVRGDDGKVRRSALRADRT
ncbi:MAG: baiB [Ilumatobacteraceae bacterium]|nr:baiB [Ilumatobacteraceae bacterium]